MNRDGAQRGTPRMALEYRELGGPAPTSSSGLEHSRNAEIKPSFDRAIFVPISRYPYAWRRLQARVAPEGTRDFPLTQGKETAMGNRDRQKREEKKPKQPKKPGPPIWNVRF